MCAVILYDVVTNVSEVWRSEEEKKNTVKNTSFFLHIRSTHPLDFWHYTYNIPCCHKLHQGFHHRLSLLEPSCKQMGGTVSLNPETGEKKSLKCVSIPFLMLSERNLNPEIQCSNVMLLWTVMYTTFIYHKYHKCTTTNKPKNVLWVVFFHERNISKALIVKCDVSCWFWSVTAFSMTK